MGLNSLQRVLGDEECNLHRAVISPKTHRAPRCIERAALIRKTQRHRNPLETVYGVRSRNRDMWTTLFSLALAAAVCFSVAAIALAYSKYLARPSESATRSLVIRAPM